MNSELVKPKTNFHTNKSKSQTKSQKHVARHQRRQEKRVQIIPRTSPPFFSLLPIELNCQLLKLLDCKSLMRCLSTCSYLKAFAELPTYDFVKQKTHKYVMLKYFEKILFLIPNPHVQSILVLTDLSVITIKPNGLSPDPGYTIGFDHIGDDDIPGLIGYSPDLKNLCFQLLLSSTINTIKIMTNIQDVGLLNSLRRFKWIDVTSDDDSHTTTITLNFSKFCKMYDFSTMDNGLTRLNKSMRVTSIYDRCTQQELSSQLESKFRLLVLSRLDSDKKNGLVADLKKSFGRLKPGSHLHPGNIKVFLKRIDKVLESG